MNFQVCLRISSFINIMLKTKHFATHTALFVRYLSFHLIQTDLDLKWYWWNLRSIVSETWILGVLFWEDRNCELETWGNKAEPCGIYCNRVWSYSSDYISWVWQVDINMSVHLEQRSVDNFPDVGNRSFDRSHAVSYSKWGIHVSL